MPDTHPLPRRLHHTAWTTRDMAATRAFYEEVIGLPLIATWCESDRLFGRVRTYVHCFFGLADGGALAFFQFADALDGDGVGMFFYAGHGGSQHFPAANTWLEGLVPLDIRQNGMLYDLELNRLLQDIADYCGNLTVVLDCCHAAGVTRTDDPAATPRYTPLPAAEGELPAVVREQLAQPLAADAKRRSSYSVLAACQADEQAVEVYPADGAGGPHRFQHFHRP